MGQALYRKYRSRSLEEVVGQEHITQTLKKAIKNGRISHAYLFTGPRGVGKTSIARILAHEINGLDYNNDNIDIDIIEIDAASNRRIDEIRELRDKVYIAPTSSKYKVYIIDEVHMLTREAFNALLKTLEEPPAHVVFILATTDVHKLPATIISRTQRYSFQPASHDQIIELLKRISKEEKFDIDDEALALIAEHAGGSFRDSVSLLDQATSNGARVDSESVGRLLGLPSTEAISRLLQLIGHGTSAEVMQSLEDIYNQGYQPSVVAQQLGERLRKQLMNNSLEINGQAALDLLNALVEVPASHNPERYLEIAILSANPALFSAKVVPVALEPEPIKKQGPPAAKVVTHSEEPESAVEIKEEAPKAKDETKSEVIKETPKQAEVKRKKTEIKAGSAPFDEDLWPDILKALKKQYNTLYGVIRMCQPEFLEDNKLKLTFAFSFHQKKLNETSNRQKVVDIIYELTGITPEIECIVDKSIKPPAITVESEPLEPLPTPPEDLANKKPQAAELSNISNIFGNAELLES